MSLSAQLFGRDSFIFKATNALGLGIPGWLDKKFGPKGTEGPRLDDLSVQTSTYGADIPRLYGTISMAGNILWLEGGKLKEVVKKNKKGGKGGASTTPTKTYTYYATFALGLCEGPIAGIRRIWCSDTLLYNAGSDDPETIIASNRNATGWKLYLGSDDQQPDSRYEADVSPGNAPAFRGLAYLVFYDFELTDYANTLQASQFKVEVVVGEGKSKRLISVATHSESTSGWSCCSNPGAEMPVVFAADWGGSYNDPLEINVYAYVSGSLVKQKTVTSPTFGGRYANSSFAKGYSDVPSILNRDGSGGGNSYLLSVYEGSSFKYFGVGLSRFAGYSQVVYCLIDSTLYVSSSAEDIGFGIEKIEIDDQSTVSSYTERVDNGVSYKQISYGDSRIACLRSTGEYLDIFDLDLNHDESIDLSSFGGISHAGFSNNFLYVIDYGNNVYKKDGESFALYQSDIWSEYQSGYSDAKTVSVGFEGGYFSFYGSSSGVSTKTTGPFAIVVSQPDSKGQRLSEIVSSEFLLATVLGSDDIHVDELEEQVSGCKISSGSIRSALEPLQAAYPFDVIQSGYQVRIVSRGKSSVRSIPLDDLYAGEDGSDDALSQSREMDSQLPNRVVIKYLDAGREYDVSQQQYQRASTASVDEMSLDLSLVLTADKAAGIAEILCYLAWLERIEFSFSLPPIYSDLEPADVVTLYDESVSYELRITETTQGIEGRTECKAVPNRASLYTSQAKGGTGVIPSGLVTLPGKSLAVLLDIPIVDESVQNDPGFLAAMTGYTAGWPGAVLIGSSDNGQTYADLQGFAGKGTLGTTAGVLTANGGTLIDLSYIRVSLVSGQLESVTRDRMLSGVNYAAYGLDGRWEIVRFQNAVLQPDGTYLVSGFLRGQRGTEWATGLHEESDWFVLLDDSDNAFIDLPSSALAESRTYKAVTSRQSADDASAQAFTYKGVNLQPLSPVYARGSRNAGSLSVTWTRRSRLSNSWWTTGVVAPLGEDVENYQVDVVSGSTVVRTIASSSAAITYTAAQQQADFGSVQSSITLRIFQLSAAVGRGRALEVTL